MKERAKSLLSKKNVLSGKIKQEKYYILLILIVLAAFVYTVATTGGSAESVEQPYIVYDNQTFVQLTENISYSDYLGACENRVTGRLFASQSAATCLEYFNTSIP